jgi:hypothetical protein
MYRNDKRDWCQKRNGIMRHPEPLRPPNKKRQFLLFLEAVYSGGGPDKNGIPRQRKRQRTVSDDSERNMRKSHDADRNKIPDILADTGHFSHPAVNTYFFPVVHSFRCRTEWDYRVLLYSSIISAGFPVFTTEPLAIHKMKSHCSTVVRRWAMIITVSVFFREWMVSMMDASVP